MIDPATALVLLRSVLTAATDAELFDKMTGDVHPDVINHFCDAVASFAEAERLTHVEAAGDASYRQGVTDGAADARLALTAAHVIVLVPGSPAWHAVYAALGQYVQNEECTEGDSDGAYVARDLDAARAVLEKCDAALCALAETGEPTRV